MNRLSIFVRVCLTSLCVLAAGAAHADRVKDLASLAAQRPNQLIGYGLVVGLQGTGDDATVPFTAQSMKATLAKMGVRRSAQGKGAGRMLVAAAIATARQMNMRRIYIETNSGLGPALKLYRDAGFQPLKEAVPSPYARADVQLELFL